MDHARSALQPAEPAPASAARAPARSVAAGGKRDLRLDLFRGLALWLIFLDHIPSNAVSWLTIRNYGFSDATEIFVFISGYTAAFVYGRAMRERGFVLATARVLRRAWQVYAAHIFLFMIYMAEIAYVAASFDNPLFAEELVAWAREGGDVDALPMTLNALLGARLDRLEARERDALERGHARLTGGRSLSLGIGAPARLAAWPGVVLYIVFLWLEMAWHGADSPKAIASVMAAYALVTWIGMWLFGRQTWLERGEFF